MCNTAIFHKKRWPLTLSLSNNPSQNTLSLSLTEYSQTLPSYVINEALKGDDLTLFVGLGDPTPSSIILDYVNITTMHSNLTQVIGETAYEYLINRDLNCSNADPLARECRVDCTEYRSCFMAIINCQNWEFCTVYCGDDESCKEVTILLEGTGNFALFCKGKEACEDSVISQTTGTLNKVDIRAIGEMSLHGTS